MPPGSPTPTRSSVALCHGWIDGQKGRLDDDYWLQRFTPRRPASKWSRINRDQAAALIEARPDEAGRAARGRAGPGGRPLGRGLRAAVHRGGARGSRPRPWTATTRPGRSSPRLDRANRYAILYRVADAKRPETRARRIATFVAMLSEGKKIHP